MGGLATITRFFFSLVEEGGFGVVVVFLLLLPGRFFGVPIAKSDKSHFVGQRCLVEKLPLLLLVGVVFLNTNFVHRPASLHRGPTGI